MNRRRFLLTSLAGAVAMPFAARAQSPPTCRIGVLDDARAVMTNTRPPLREGFREFGYVEGKNLTSSAFGGRQFDHLPALAADFVRRKCAVIVTHGDAWSPCREAATATIPIVSSNAAIRSDWVSLLASPDPEATEG